MPIDSTSTPEQIKDYWARTNPENFIGAKALRAVVADLEAGGALVDELIPWRAMARKYLTTRANEMDPND